jgi:hypothetical protein
MTELSCGIFAETYRLAKKTRNREHDARDPHDQASKQRKLAQ